MPSAAPPPVVVTVDPPGTFDASVSGTPDADVTPLRTAVPAAVLGAGVVVAEWASDPAWWANRRTWRRPRSSPRPPDRSGRRRRRTGGGRATRRGGRSGSGVPGSGRGAATTAEDGQPAGAATRERAALHHLDTRDQRQRRREHDRGGDHADRQSVPPGPSGRAAHPRGRRSSRAADRVRVRGGRKGLGRVGRVRTQPTHHPAHLVPGRTDRVRIDRAGCDRDPGRQRGAEHGPGDTQPRTQDRGSHRRGDAGQYLAGRQVKAWTFPVGRPVRVRRGKVLRERSWWRTGGWRGRRAGLRYASVVIVSWCRGRLGMSVERYRRPDRNRLTVDVTGAGGVARRDTGHSRQVDTQIAVGRTRA